MIFLFVIPSKYYGFIYSEAEVVSHQFIRMDALHYILNVALKTGN